MSEINSKINSETSISIDGLEEFRKYVGKNFLIELLVQVLALCVPAGLLVISQNGGVLLKVIVLVLSYYLYCLGIIIVAGVIAWYLPKPSKGYLTEPKEIRKLSHIVSINFFVRRSLARWMVFIFPFPGHLYYRLSGANIFPCLQLADADNIQDPHWVSIGKRTVIGEKAIIAGHYVPQSRTVYLGQVEIGDDVLIGRGVSIWPNVKIGNGARIQENSSVMPGTIIPAGELWGGNPACSLMLNQVRSTNKSPGSDPDLSDKNLNPENIKNLVTSFCNQTYKIDIEELNFELPLIETGILDSLAFLSLIQFIEENLNFELPKEKINYHQHSMNNFIKIVQEVKGGSI